MLVLLWSPRANPYSSFKIPPPTLWSWPPRSWRCWKLVKYNIISVMLQLLDCFVIPVLMVLSWIFLKTRYRPLHFIAVVVCLFGVGAMVGADLLAGRDQGSSTYCTLYWRGRGCRCNHLNYALFLLLQKIIWNEDNYVKMHEEFIIDCSLSVAWNLAPK